MAEGALRFEGVSKAFPGVRALHDVSFTVEARRVHALMGENGAGKSTLLKVLSGAIRPDSGRLVIDDRPQRFRNAQDAIAAGIAVIYQELQLVPDLSVAENLFLGHLPNRFGQVRRGELAERSRELLARVGESIDPRQRLGDLPIAQRQMVEIAKALSRDARVLAFDEPTSSLSRREVDRLFGLIERLRDEGRILLYVSHRMDEIYSICQAATVLRDGRHVETFADLGAVTEADLVERMVGRRLESGDASQRARVGEPVLEVEGLTGRELPKPASLIVRQGEIVGMFGLVGAGRTELLKLIYGAQRRRGTVRVAGRAVDAGPRAALRSGLAWCPEDRKAEGIVPLASVQDNVNLGTRMGPVLRLRDERRRAEQMVQRFGIRTASLRTPVGTLSGGNQQKTILARVVSHPVRAMLLDEPTRGIDVGAKREIYGIIRELAQTGVGVLFASSEMPEILNLSDRILVMRGGEIVGELSRADATPEVLLRLALPAAETL